jgi:hypothetical protein
MGLMRVVATRIEWDGTMQRRVVDTAAATMAPSGLLLDLVTAMPADGRRHMPARTE